MTFPVRTVVVPSVLNGQSNGKLPASILVATPGQSGGPTVLLVEPAARAWRALCAAAKQAGHTLKISGPSSAYRTYAVQETLFRQRFTTSPVSQTKRLWLGQTWYLRPGYALAAVPGTSNHGRGLAVDTGVELDGDSGTESIDAPTLNWLLANEERFGFSHEVQSEPWHIRYFTGDRIPQAVLDFERSTTPTPPPAPPARKDPDMAYIVTCDGEFTRLKDGPTCPKIEGATVLSAVKAGIPVIDHTKKDYDALLAHVGEALGRDVVAAIEAD